MKRKSRNGLLPYSQSLAGTLLAAREAVMAPIRPFLRASNVTEQQWRVLRVLCQTETLDARSIADQALLYPPSVTRILKELADRGLIDRMIDKKDARRSLISITQRGRALVDTTAVHTRALLNAYGKAFGVERLEAFRKEAAEFAAILSQFQPVE